MSGPQSAKEKGKKLAQNFLYKLADSFDLKQPETPPKPLPSQFDNLKISSAPSSDESITSAFNTLTISNPQKYDAASSVAPFVGGFNPIVHGNSYTANHATNSNSVSAPHLTIPMAIPAPYHGHPPSLTPGYPQSLTMQMALRPGQDIPPINRTHSNPIPSSTSSGNTAFPTPGSSKPSHNRPLISPSTPSKPTKSQDSGNTAFSTPGPLRPSNNRPLASPSTPNKLTKSQASSVASSPSQKTGQIQCSGFTKANKRCNRMVKTKPSTAALLLDDDDDEGPVPQFCFQHAKEVLGNSGYYARKNGEWVKFEDWIPPYLQSETQVSLRVEMEKARSKSDVYGYIYTFEIREPDETETIKLKVGRAVNLVKRIDQWGKQCGSKEQILRGFFPGTVEPDEDGNAGSLMKGRVKAGEKGAWCHRLERLVHLELGDLVCSSIYLDPAWPDIDVSTSSNTETKSGRSKDSNNSNNSVAPCPDCGSMHKEIFEFQRWKRGKNQGKEWANLVKPVIERWGKFVELYV